VNAGGIRVIKTEGKGANFFVDNSISVDRGGLRNGIQMSTVWYWSKSRWFGRCFGPKKVDEKNN